MNETIVVGVDGSATAWKAACTAHDLAAALGATVHVVCAFDSDRAEIVGSGSDKVILSDAAAADKVAQTVAESIGTGVKVTYTAARGNPANALLTEAVQINARMIVVGNRRMHGIGRVLGSVANTVAHNASCDVYIAHTASN